MAASIQPLGSFEADIFPLLYLPNFYLEVETIYSASGDVEVDAESDDELDLDDLLSGIVKVHSAMVKVRKVPIRNASHIPSVVRYYIADFHLEYGSLGENVTPSPSTSESYGPNLPADGQVWSVLETEAAEYMARLNTLTGNGRDVARLPEMSHAPKGSRFIPIVTRAKNPQGEREEVVWIHDRINNWMKDELTNRTTHDLFQILRRFFLMGQVYANTEGLCVFDNDTRRWAGVDEAAFCSTLHMGIRWLIDCAGHIIRDLQSYIDILDERRKVLVEKMKALIRAVDDADDDKAGAMKAEISELADQIRGLSDLINMYRPTVIFGKFKISKFLTSRGLKASLLDEVRAELSLHGPRYMSLAHDRIAAGAAILPFANGTYNMETGEMHPRYNLDRVFGYIEAEFIPLAVPTPECWSKTYPVAWEYLNEVTCGQRETLEDLLIALYLGLLPVNRHKLLIFLHSGGNSGKSTLLDNYRLSLGRYSGMVQQMPAGMMSTSQTSTSTHDGKMSKLTSAIRCLYTDETAPTDTWNAQQVKLFANGFGEHQVRAAYSRDTITLNIAPLVLVCSNTTSMPHIKCSPGDDAITNRIRFIEMPCTYRSREQYDRIDDEEKHRFAVADPDRMAAMIRDGLRPQLISFIVTVGGHFYKQRMAAGMEPLPRNQEMERLLLTKASSAPTVDLIKEWFHRNYRLVPELTEAYKSQMLQPRSILEDLMKSADPLQMRELRAVPCLSTKDLLGILQLPDHNGAVITTEKQYWSRKVDGRSQGLQGSRKTIPYARARESVDSLTVEESTVPDVVYTSSGAACSSRPAST